jgi:hypothetical protein
MMIGRRVGGGRSRRRRRRRRRCCKNNYLQMLCLKFGEELVAIRADFL